MKKLFFLFALVTELAVGQVTPQFGGFVGAGSVAGPGSGGGTGPYSPASFTQYGVLYGGGAGPITAASALTSGRVPFATTNGILIDTANLTFTDGTTTGQLIHPVGAAATPSVTFLGDTDNGLYYVTTNSFGVATAGVPTLIFSGGAAAVLTGGAGNMTIIPGTGNSRNLILQTTTSGGVAQNAATFSSTLADLSPNQVLSKIGTAASVGFACRDAGSGMYSSASNQIALATNGVVALTFDSSQTALFAKKISSYNGVATAGWGVPAIQAAGRVTAQTAANASISTYTVGAADGSFEVSANMNVTASTTLITTLTCTYTDEASATRSMIFPVSGVTGSFIALGAISGAGASVWETPVMHIRCKASTAITILTSAGTFTGVTYTAEGIIKQTN